MYLCETRFHTTHLRWRTHVSIIIIAVMIHISGRYVLAHDGGRNISRNVEHILSIFFYERMCGNTIIALAIETPKVLLSQTHGFLHDYAHQAFVLCASQRSYHLVLTKCWCHTIVHSPKNSRLRGSSQGNITDAINTSPACILLLLVWDLTMIVGPT